jgi:hypothetical protein
MNNLVSNDDQALVFAIDVQRPDGTVDHLVIRHARVLVGAGAHCDIRIDGTGAAREHVELQLQGETLLARGLFHAPPPFVRGAPLVASALESGEQIAVCGTRITIRIVRENAQRTTLPKRRLAMVLAAVVSLFLPAIVYGALKPPSEDAIAPAPEPTPLWSAAALTCKFGAADLALHHAKQMRAVAEGSRERYPFAIEDGVVAVTSFEMAAACYRAGGKNDEAGHNTDEADALKAIVDRDYHAHRVRLEHAIETDDLFAAVFEVRMLRSLTRGLKGPYFDWLGIVERRLEANLRAAADKGDS